jgi:hypothetical protein
MSFKSQTINGFTSFPNIEEAKTYAKVDGKVGKKSKLRKIWPCASGGYWASQVAGTCPVEESVKQEEPAMA